mgnify:FL=1
MTIEKQLDDGTILEFPDGTTPEVISNTIKRITASSPESVEMKQPETVVKAPIEAQGEIVQASNSDSVSIADYLRQSLGQGTALGFGDEIEGFVRGLYSAATEGRDISQAINAGIDEVRAKNKKFEDENFKTAMALQVGGGLLTGGMGAGRALAAKGLSLGQKMYRGAKVGGGIGAVTGAGMSEGGLTSDGMYNRAIGAGLGATLGATGGVVLPGAGALIKKGSTAVSRVLPDIPRMGFSGGSTRQAEGLFRNQAAGSGLNAQSLKQGLDELGPQGVVADLGNRNVRDLARFAGNKDINKTAQDMLQKRNVEQGLRIEAQIDKQIADKSLGRYLLETNELRRLDANKNYGKLRETPVELSSNLKGFFQNVEIQDAYKGAKKIAGVKGEKLTPLFTKDKKTGVKTYLKPDMKTLDYIKQAMDDKVDAAFRGSNPAPRLGDALKTLRNNFRNHVDELVPEYKQVRSNYAGHSAAMESAEEGAKFINSKTYYMPNIKEMGAHELEAFKVGVADALRYKVLSPQDGADVTKKIFGSELNRRRLKLAFGSDAKGKADYKEFEKVIKNEIKMGETNAAVSSGSRTHPMAMDEANYAKPFNLISDSTGAIMGNPMAQGRLSSKIADMLQTPPEAVARKLSKLLLSQNPEDKAEAIRILGKGQTKGNKLSNFLTRPAAISSGYVGGMTQGN